MPGVIGDLSINLLASALFVALGEAFIHLLIPWYQALVYKGVEVEGKWINELEHQGAKFRYEINLTQKGHVLTGNATITKSKALTGNYEQPFEVSGSVWEGFVTLNLRSSDRKTVSIATGLFYIAERGTRLTGSLAYRRFAANDVGTEELQLYRQASQS